MKEWWRIIALWLKRIRRFLVKANGTPHQIALGVAVGFFVGWLPIMGIQMGVALILCTMLRCNPVVPLGPIWLTNPVTFIPIFYANYCVGWYILGGPRPRTVINDLRGLIPSDLTADFWCNPPLWLYSWLVEFFRNARQSIRDIIALGADMMLPLWLGSALVGIVLAVIGYYLTHWTVTTFRARLASRSVRRS